MTLLVAGADRVDAGKTTFATGLLSFLRRHHDDPRGFKPRAGNDHWFDHDDVLAATSRGRLYGKDARRLADAEGTDRRPEALNPLHRLWKPTPGRSGPLGEPDRTFLLDRLTTPGGEEYVVNAAADLPPVIRESLPIDDATRIGSVEALDEVMADRYLPAFERLAETVRAADTAVVESYSDIALPLSDVEYDAVAVVEPRRVRVFDGRRWTRACEVARGSPREGRLEERVGAVLEMIEPIERLTLQPLSGEARSDPATVADAYADAYGALLEAA